MADQAAIEMKEGIEGAAKEGEGGEGEDPGAEGGLAHGEEGVQEPVDPRAHLLLFMARFISAIILRLVNIFSINTKINVNNNNFQTKFKIDTVEY